MTRTLMMRDGLMRANGAPQKRRISRRSDTAWRSLFMNFEHPLAIAVVAAAQQKQLVIGEPSAFSCTSAKGSWMATLWSSENTALLKEAHVSLPAMSTTAGTRVLVARDGNFVGSIQIADQVRDGASEAIRELREMGLPAGLWRDCGRAVLHAKLYIHCAVRLPQHRQGGCPVDRRKVATLNPRP